RARAPPPPPGRAGAPPPRGPNRGAARRRRSSPGPPVPRGASGAAAGPAGCGPEPRWPPGFPGGRREELSRRRSRRSREYRRKARGCYEQATMENTRPLSEVDPAIASLLRQETQRQEEGLELIASENFVSPAVLEAVGSTLTNKYAEGYPGRRYYGGCEVVDQVETLAIDRVKKLFGAEAAN